MSVQTMPFNSFANDGHRHDCCGLHVDATQWDREREVPNPKARGPPEVRLNSRHDN
jgi:hypothetical protein